MKTFKTALFATILSAILFSAGCGPSSSSNQTGNQPAVVEGVNIGNRAPDFQLQDMSGKSVKLSDYRGQPVLLNFWATWCGPCKYEAPFLSQINTDYAPRGLVMLAVDIGENATTIQNFETSLNISLPVLMDANVTISKVYGLTGIPTTFMVDKDGVIRFKLIGAFPDKAAIEAAITNILP
jgi:peroxiredoxin